MVADFLVNIYDMNPESRSARLVGVMRTATCDRPGRPHGRFSDGKEFERIKFFFKKERTGRKDGRLAGYVLS